MKRCFSCIDKETGKEMILTDVSYNSACFWLDTELKRNGHKITTCLPAGDLIRIETTCKRDFFYDEIRGYLLGD